MENLTVNSKARSQKAKANRKDVYADVMCKDICGFQHNPFVSDIAISFALYESSFVNKQIIM